MKTNKLTKGANVRWESSRMVLPEHVAALKDYDIEKRKVIRPTLDEQEIEMVERKIRAAIKDRQPIQLRYYKNGFIKDKVVYPASLDAVTRQLICHDAFGLKWMINFVDILGATVSTEALD
ncbi:MAG: YolD-like family protein [Sporolactobacillus sp.]